MKRLDPRVLITSTCVLLLGISCALIDANQSGDSNNTTPLPDMGMVVDKDMPDEVDMSADADMSTPPAAGCSGEGAITCGEDEVCAELDGAGICIKRWDNGPLLAPENAPAPVDTGRVVYTYDGETGTIWLAHSRENGAENHITVYQGIFEPQGVVWAREANHQLIQTPSDATSAYSLTSIARHADGVILGATYTQMSESYPVLLWAPKGGALLPLEQTTPQAEQDPAPILSARPLAHASSRVLVARAGDTLLAIVSSCDPDTPSDCALNFYAIDPDNIQTAPDNSEHRFELSAPFNLANPNIAPNASFLLGVDDTDAWISILGAKDNSARPQYNLLTIKASTLAGATAPSLTPDGESEDGAAILINNAASGGIKSDSLDNLTAMTLVCPDHPMLFGANDRFGGAHIIKSDGDGGEVVLAMDMASTAGGARDGFYVMSASRGANEQGGNIATRKGKLHQCIPDTRSSTRRLLHIAQQPGFEHRTPSFAILSAKDTDTAEGDEELAVFTTTTVERVGKARERALVFSDGAPGVEFLRAYTHQDRYYVLARNLDDQTIVTFSMSVNDLE